MLFELLKVGLILLLIDVFYFFVWMMFVKDEQYFDKFDQVFGVYFYGVFMLLFEVFDILFDWFEKCFECELLLEEKVQIDVMGGFDKLMECLKVLFDEQKECYEGGNKWIGMGGMLLFGYGGYNFEGVCIGGLLNGNCIVVKVWEVCVYCDYDDLVEIGMCNIKVVLWWLCCFVCEGVVEEFDLFGMICSMVVNVGWFDLWMVFECYNNVKVLMLFDVGGLMDDYIKCIEELFLVVKVEFKYFEFFYFYNCVYDYLWKNNCCCYVECIVMWDVLYKFMFDYKLIFVGDVMMSLYEVLQFGGLVEYNNLEVGVVWLCWFVDQFFYYVWLNFEFEWLWEYW